MRKSRRANFSITFDERQKIHQCRSKLLKALHALDIDIDIIQGYKARYRHLAKTRGSQRSDTSLQDFEWHLTELRAHRTATIRIMGHCTWTANLVTFLPSVSKVAIADKKRSKRKSSNTGMTKQCKPTFKHCVTAPLPKNPKAKI